MDRAFSGAHVITAAVVSASGWALAPWHGWLLAIAATMPLAHWMVSQVLLPDLVSSLGWHRARMCSHALSAIIGVAATGGLVSPVVVFLPLLGLFPLTFPHEWLPKAIAPTSAAAVTLIDVGVGRASGSLLGAASLLLAACITTLFAARFANVEVDQRRRAKIDPLTGCLNRAALDTHLDALLSRRDPGIGRLVAITFDLDDFKRVNDDHGHHVGDLVLVGVTEIVAATLERGTPLFRLGGEEFLVLVTEIDPVRGERIAERIRRAVEERPIVGLPVSASFGVAGQTAPLDVERLLAEADEAMYSAKHAGRNRVRTSGT